MLSLDQRLSKDLWGFVNYGLQQTVYIIHKNIWATIFENQPKWRSRQNLVNYTRLIYEMLRIYPANFMKLSPLFMEMWSPETIHCLNFNSQRQKRHDVTNNVKVNFLIYALVGCMKNMLVLSNVLFYYP